MHSFCVSLCSTSPTQPARSNKTQDFSAYWLILPFHFKGFFFSGTQRFIWLFGVVFTRLFCIEFCKDFFLFVPVHLLRCYTPSLNWIFQPYPHHTPTTPQNIQFTMYKAHLAIPMMMHQEWHPCKPPRLIIPAQWSPLYTPQPTEDRPIPGLPRPAGSPVIGGIWGLTGRGPTRHGQNWNAKWFKKMVFMMKIKGMGHCLLT